MKIRFTLLSLLTITALALAACGTASQSTEESGYPYPYPGATEPSDIGTLPALTSETTEPATTVETTPETTLESTPEATMPPESTAVPTQSITGTAVIPPTGFVDPGRLSNLLEFQVWDKSNTQIGDVEDLVLDIDAMKVSYVILKTSQDGKLIPIPWEALTVVSAQAQPTSTLQTPVAGASVGQNGFLLNVDKSVVDQAPEIQPADVPGLGASAEGWDSDFSSYWNVVLGGLQSGTPAPTQTPAAMTGLHGAVLATRLLDYSMQLGQNLAKASVADVIVDVRTGAIQYVVVSVSGEGGGEKLIPIPLPIFSWDTTNQAFILTANLDTLVNAPGFENGEFPVTQMADWDAQFRDYWSQYITPGP